MKKPEAAVHQQRPARDLCSGGGEMGERVRLLDWSKTPLGPIEQWPQSLKTSVSICLNSRFAILIWWGKDLVKIYNDAYTAILGRKHPSALGTPGKNVWPEIWNVIGPMLEGVMERGEATWSDNLLLELEGNGYPEERYFTFSYSPIRDESGGIGGVFTPVQETTRQVIGERRVRTLRDLAEDAGSPAARTSAQVCQISASTLARNPFDIPFAAFYLFSDHGDAQLAATAGVENPVPVLPPAVRLDDSEWTLAGAVRKGETCLVEIPGELGAIPKGAWPVPPREALVVPIEHSGQQRGFMILAVNPRKRLDDDYRAFRSMVGQHVNTAIAEAHALEQEHQRSEALAELNRAKTRFFANVSHEFRTPLTLMLGPIEDVLSSVDELPAKVRDSLVIVHRNSLRLLRLVNSLLDFARIEAGRTNAVFEPVDLGAITAEIVSNFRSATERAGLDLSVECATLREPVYIDREMWEKIVLNLLSNAFKYTFVGGIRVVLYRVDGAVELHVVDTGTGIPAHEIPRLFERFHRVENARGRTMEGTGIGLALVHELVKMHGGDVRVDSEPGHGSTFVVRIPTGCGHLPPSQVSNVRGAGTTIRADAYVAEALRWLPDAKGAPDDPVQERAPDWTDCGEGQPANRPRVLIADDNADMRDYLRRLLETRYEVITAENGHQAFESARDRLPDLVLSDVMMPGVDGFGLLERLRANRSTRTIPILFLSARAGEESRSEGMQAGADDYLTKPFSARELLARVSAHVKLAALRRQSEEMVRAVFESSADCLKILDRDGRVTDINGTGLRLLEADDFEAVKGKEWASFWTGSEAELPRIALAKARSGQVGRFQGMCATAKGSPRYWDVIVTAVFDNTGAVERYVAVSRDMTEVRKADQALRAGEQRLQFALDAARMGMWHQDLRSGAVVCSPQLYVVLGLGPDKSEGTAQSWWSMVHAEDRERVLRSAREAIRSHEPREAEFRCIRPDGSEIWLSSRGAAEYGADGQPLSIAGIAIDITARKKAEMALAISEQRLRLAQSAARIGTWDWDLLTNEMHWQGDAQFLHTVGADGRVKTYEEFLERLHAEDRGRVADAISTAIADNTDYEQEFRVTYSGGSTRWLLGRGKVLRDMTGRPIRMVGVNMDVTETRRAVRALADTTQRLQAALDASATGTFYWNIRTDELAWDDPLGRLFGYPPGLKAATLQEFLALVHPADRSEVRLATERSRYSGVDFDLEFRIVREDGSERWLYDRGRTFKDDAGRPLYMTGACVDITDRRRAVERLRESEERFRTLVEKVPELVWATDANGQCNFVNRKFEEFTGLRAEQMLGFGWKQALHPADLQATLESWLSAVAARTSWQTEYRLRRSDGSYRWHVARAVPIPTEPGEPGGWFGTSSDIDDQKQTEQALRSANDDLNQFAFAVAHDLREPLRNIAAYSELLTVTCGRHEDPKVTKIQSVIAEGVRRMDELLADLLEYTRIARDNDEETVTTDCGSAVDKAIDNLRTAIQASGAVILKDALPVVAGSEIRYIQLFQNLIGNAIKYRSEQRPEVRISARREQGEWLFSVRDNGMGIEPEFRELIFGLFKRLHGREIPGTGIGLAICQKIVQRYGGRIWVHSEPGAGSDFRFTVPFLAGQSHTRHVPERLSG